MKLKQMRNWHKGYLKGIKIFKTKNPNENILDTMDFEILLNFHFMNRHTIASKSKPGTLNLCHQLLIFQLETKERTV